MDASWMMVKADIRATVRGALHNRFLHLNSQELTPYAEIAMLP